MILIKKRVLVICILGNSSNESFNAFQSIVGFFCDSQCVPEVVCEMMAHMGVSVSLGTTRNMIKSLRKHANARLKKLPPSNMIYDNFDMDFRVAQPTAGHQGTHISVTAATFAPYVNVTAEDLCFTKELHETSCFNKDLEPDDPKIYKPCAEDILPELEPVLDSDDEDECDDDNIDMPSRTPPSDRLDPLRMAFAWHFRQILVEHEPGFKKYKSRLGSPQAIHNLPVQQTVQVPANAINADEGQNDGNWEVLKNLLNQVSINHRYNGP